MTLTDKRLKNAVKDMTGSEPAWSFPDAVEEFAADNMTVVVFEPGKSLPEGEYCHCDSGILFTFGYPLAIDRVTGQSFKRIVKTPQVIGVVIEKKFFYRTARLIFGSAWVLYRKGRIKTDPAMLNLIRMFMEEAGRREAGHGLCLESLTVLITVSLLRQLRQAETPKTKYPYSAKENIDKAIDLFTGSYMGHHSLKDAARVCNLSQYHFIRVFKDQTGKTPYQFLMDVKIEKACELLRFNYYTVTEVCFLCGFNNLSHFTTVFKKRTGMRPKEYRLRLHTLG